MKKTRQDAWNLVNEFIKNPNLIKHVLSVEAAMRAYAVKFGQDQDEWATIGLVHDFDWEIHPTLDEHPIKGVEILREREWDEDIIHAVLSHYPAGTGVYPANMMEFALMACDEITGLITATALVRPSKDIRDVRVKSIKKKWKDRAFAAGVDREQVIEATDEFIAYAGAQLEVWDLWKHVEFVLEAMNGIASELDLDGSLAQSDS
ncbi:MAG: HDIG domain-containing protein [Anaerolineales bacterium]|nr:HDIG domain-containing protein [Anaerolineales bacterium]